MKILLTYMSYLPHVGGVWTYVRELKKGLESQGHIVDVFAWHPSLDYYYQLDTNLKIDYKSVRDFVTEKVHHYFDRHLPNVGNWIRNHEIRRYTFELASYIFGLEDYDLIHAQCARTAIAISRVKPPHIPLIVSPHSYMTNEFFLSKGKNVDKLQKKYIAHIEFLGCYLSDKTIVASHSLKTKLKDFGVKDDKFTVIPYGIDMNKFQEAMKKKEFSLPTTQKKIIVCPARLVFEKGHKFLLEALARLKKEHQNWTCWIIGDGDYRSTLEKKVTQLNIQDDVVFLGDRSDVPSLLKHADIFVLPSLNENLPFAVMEAQIAGMPVIASDTGGVPEMIEHGVTGLLYPTFDSHSLFENIKLVLENHFFADALGKNAKKWAEKAWPIELSISRTLKEYEKVVERFPRTEPMNRPSHENRISSDSLAKIYQNISDRYQIPDPNLIRFFENQN